MTANSGTLVPIGQAAVGREGYHQQRQTHGSPAICLHTPHTGQLVLLIVVAQGKGVGKKGGKGGGGLPWGGREWLYATGHSQMTCRPWLSLYPPTSREVPRVGLDDPVSALPWDPSNRQQGAATIHPGRGRHTVQLDTSTSTSSPSPIGARISALSQNKEPKPNVGPPLALNRLDSWRSYPEP